eukprot:m.327820 g.327820  ORF g.327820 m.327820 type:complete len:343 (+) comp55584_c0_seq3:1429-2457(+)
MVEILPASSPLYQVAAFLLLASTACCDMLMLRVVLFLGFLFLFIWGAYGLAAWPDIENPANILPVDSLVWNGLNMILQLALVVRLVWQYRQELKRSFHSPREQRLYCGLRRVAGFSYTDTKTLLSHGQWEIFHAGAHIQKPREAPEYFSIICSGLVEAWTEKNTVPFLLTSLDTFDYSLLGPLGVDFGMMRPLIVRAKNDAVLFRVHRDNFPALANRSGLIASLKHLILFSFSNSVRRKHGGKISSLEVTDSPNMRPLTEEENPPFSLWKYIKNGLANPFGYQPNFSVPMHPIVNEFLRSQSGATSDTMSARFEQQLSNDSSDSAHIYSISQPPRRTPTVCT